MMVVKVTAAEVNVTVTVMLRVMSIAMVTAPDSSRACPDGAPMVSYGAPMVPDGALLVRR